jgi:uncharacterized protein
LTTFLLDVNVLIALADPHHLQHDAAHTWFQREGRKSFASCPLTENGLLRIVGHPRYPNSPGPPQAVMPLLQAFRKLAGHEFWPDAFSAADTPHLVPQRLHHHGHVTDSYLLALAKSRHGRLATLDHKLSTAAVPGGDQAVCFIPVR